MTKKEIKQKIIHIKKEAEIQIKFLNEFGEKYSFTKYNVDVYKEYLKATAKLKEEIKLGFSTVTLKMY